MDSIIHGLAGAGAVFSLPFLWEIFKWGRDALANRSETKAALAADSERARARELDDYIRAAIDSALERKALPAPEAK